MTWLTWRQFRAQTLVTAVALAALALFLVYVRGEIESFYDTKILNCVGNDCGLNIREFTSNFEGRVTIVAAMLIAAPGLIGLFWGAPLVTRELEERTDRLVWNQSVTRGRWLVVKLGLIALITAATMGLFSLLLTWSVSRYDQIVADRFVALSFDSRNIVPIGYGILAFVLGTVVGMVVRRTLPAMTITLVLFAALQILVPVVVRAHLMPPVTANITLDADVFGRFDGMGINDEGVFIHGYNVPGGWSLTDEAQVYHPDGTPYTQADSRQCMAVDDREAGEACTIAQNLHFEHTYQPGSRYWPFQWIELGMYLALSALLALFGFWWLRRRV